MMQTYRKGDLVHVTLDGDSGIGTVLFVSLDGRNLLLRVDGFFCGAPMPVVWAEGQGWRELAQGRAVEIRPAQHLP